jgi:hypothetical protein
MTYYSIGQVGRYGIGQAEALVWEAGPHPSQASFMKHIKSSASLLDAGNFAAAQGSVKKALGLRAVFRDPTHRREADRFLMKFISPKLTAFGMQLKNSPIRDTITLEKITKAGALVGPLPMIGLAIIVGGSFLGTGYLFFKKVLKKKKLV